MKRPMLPVIAVVSLTILWSTASWYWYTCVIKNTCSLPKVVLTNATSTRAAIPPRETLPPMRTVEVLPTCPLLTEHLRYGWNNDPAQVALLERMLTSLGLGNVPRDGLFSKEEQKAIAAFQTRFAAEVWTSRSIKVRGAVDKVAREKLNSLYCEYLMSSKL